MMATCEKLAITPPAALSVPASVVGPGAAVKAMVHEPEVPPAVGVQTVLVALVVDPPNGVMLRDILIGCVAVLVKPVKPEVAWRRRALFVVSACEATDEAATLGAMIYWSVTGTGCVDAA